jgi:hypothetical protein
MEFGYRFSKIINNYHKTPIRITFLPQITQIFSEDQQLICAGQRNQQENSLAHLIHNISKRMSQKLSICSFSLCVTFIFPS